MPTRYRMRQELRFDELFDGRLESYGIHEIRGSEDDRWEQFRCLTNGRDYVYCYPDEFGFLLSMMRPSFHTSQQILAAISEVFDTEIVSEHEPQYWGYATWEALDAAEAELAERMPDSCYLDVMRSLRGHARVVQAETNGTCHESPRDLLRSDQI